MKNILKGALVAMLCLGAVFSASPALAVKCPDGSRRGSADSLAECNIKSEEKGDGLFEIIKTGVNVVIGIVGVISTIVIIISGISMATSQGDPGKTKKAKDTLIYAVLGLIIALLSFAIVNFVLVNIFKS